MRLKLEGHSTLAERLRNAGYRTAAFTGGAYVAAGFGFGQGFEIYEDHDEGIEGGPEGIAGAALAWSRSVKDVPFFLFVHTYVVHFPYTHTDFVDPSSGALQGKIFNVKELDAVHHGRRVLTPAERRWLSDLYDGDVACADRVMGGMLETMRRMISLLSGSPGTIGTWPLRVGRVASSRTSRRMSALRALRSGP